MLESTEAALYADVSDRGKLRFSGPQRGWFLHQILTQDFEDIEPYQAREAALLTAHGRMVGYLEAVATEEAILVHFDPSLSETLPDAIRRYVLSTDVEVEDVTDTYKLVLLLDGAVALAQNLGVTQPTSGFGIGRKASYLWVHRQDAEFVFTALHERGAVSVDEDRLERLRIAAGRPRWGYEMNTKTIPQEVGIDDVAVRYDKGCYVGQEAMAKIHFRGKPNRKLVRLIATGPVTAGTELSSDGTVVGRVTSAADGNALGVVKHTVPDGAELHAGTSVLVVDG
jgi:folate-binding protein YgfZ